jgi:hypothetical protein
MKIYLNEYREIVTPIGDMILCFVSLVYKQDVASIYQRCKLSFFVNKVKAIVNL